MSNKDPDMGMQGIGYRGSLVKVVIAVGKDLLFVACLLGICGVYGLGLSHWEQRARSQDLGFTVWGPRVRV